MKKQNFFYYYEYLYFFFNSCRSDNDSNNDDPNIASSELIGTWKIIEYRFINYADGKLLGSIAPECSAENEYILGTDNFLHVTMHYFNTTTNNCFDDGYDEGTWYYNNSTKSITFWDETYKLNSINKNSMEIIKFDEGYIEYYDTDYNNDGVSDKVITILKKQ